ncbi:hypothetical protein QQF64_022731 [Cirrhinus molitorella]|uniref:Uncharacterized protein n=1 Tax=Cirrhinus molitorella TaxID=172907 RepID=A0ABR3L378_9TELE
MSYSITAPTDEQNETGTAQSASRGREGWKGGGIVSANPSIREQSCQGNRPKTQTAKETEVSARSYDHVAGKEREREREWRPSRTETVHMFFCFSC